MMSCREKKKVLVGFVFSRQFSCVALAVLCVSERKADRQTYILGVGVDMCIHTQLPMKARSIRSSWSLSLRS